MLKYKLEGKVYTKARPRSRKFSTQVYTAPTYDQWKRAAIQEFKKLHYGKPPIAVASLVVTIQGKHSGDPDNTAGAVLDAMKQAGVIEDDKMENIPDFRVIYEPGGLLGVEVKFTDIEFKSLPLENAKFKETIKLMEFPL